VIPMGTTLCCNDFVSQQKSALFDAYNAPFPDAGHKAALRAFSQIMASTSKVGQEADELVAASGIARFPA
jgi:hypothetical protein